ncbi:MAG: DoxX family protein [Bradymonadales bacterium]|nr:MAG: DoxX family protein [Bradymonadales bacterium]
MTSYLILALQVVVALGLLNVWLLRPMKATRFRGGQAQTLKEEFAAYGLPEFAFYLVGALKILCALLLIGGIWLSYVVQPAALLVLILMLGALAMHIKVKDPILKSLPAFSMLAMSLALILML